MELRIVEGDKSIRDVEPEKVVTEMKGAISDGRTETEQAEAGDNED